jgi:hypothetical protein
MSHKNSGIENVIPKRRTHAINGWQTGADRVSLPRRRDDMHSGKRICFPGNLLLSGAFRRSENYISTNYIPTNLKCNLNISWSACDDENQ